LSPAPLEPRGWKAGRRLPSILAVALAGTILLAGLGGWLLLHPESTPAADSAVHQGTPQGLQSYLGRSQIAPDQPVVYPEYVNGVELRNAYQFAVDRPDVLMYLPCYCGCALHEGHRSNLDCFIKGIDGAGALLFDDHASGCEICVNIALDAKRLLAEGKPLPEIRKAIDQAYDKVGPGTNTPLPPG